MLITLVIKREKQKPHKKLLYGDLAMVNYVRPRAPKDMHTSCMRTKKPSIRSNTNQGITK